MTGPPHSDGFSAASPPPELGLRRLNWILLIVGEEGPECWAHGIGHRRPARRAIPLSTAAALIASGTPVVVRRATARPVDATRDGAAYARQQA